MAPQEKTGFAAQQRGPQARTLEDKAFYDDLSGDL
jgi:hypothetical protein